MTPTFDRAKIEHYEKMFKDAIDYAKNVGLPLTVVEASLRDMIAKVDAQRLLAAWRELGVRL